MPLHLKEFQREQLQGYIENIGPEKTYALANVLPDLPTYDINFAYNVVNGEYGDSASITGWNASAPLRDKREVEKAFGQVSKVQHGIRLDEKELLAYNKPRSDGEQQQVIEYVYNETDNLSYGVDEIAEYMRAKAVYDGLLVYEDKKNDISVNVDFGIPEENKLDNTVSWAEKDSTPLNDIQNAVGQFKATNQRRKPTVMHMTSKTETLLLTNEQIRVQVLGEGGGRLITKEDLQNTFSVLGLPPYVINDDVVIINGEEEQLLDDNKIVLIGQDLGNTMIGPTVENDYNPGKFVLPKITFDPPGQTIIIGAALFPALKKPSAIVTMNV